MKIYLNGEMVDRADAKVSVFDRGVLYGDGVFEGIRVYDGMIFRLPEHLRRLYDSAHSLDIAIPISSDEMAAAIKQTVAANEVRNGYIRTVVTRGEGDLGLNPQKCGTPTIFIIADTLKLYPQEFYDNGLEIISSSVKRNIPEALDPQIKSCNYLNNILAVIEANNANKVEALMVNAQGYVVECTADNIFIIRDNRLITPATYLGALPGITRGVVLELAPALGLEPIEGIFTKHELYISDECFLTGTGAEIVPVVGIDGRNIGTGKVGDYTRKVIAAFKVAIKQGGTGVDY